MRTSVILNLKGGVGKTTTLVNMAAILAKRHHKRVLVVDADSQCNATEFFGADPTLGNLADMLRSLSTADTHQDFSQKSNFPGVDIIPGAESLMDLDLTKVEMGSAQVSVLRNLLGAYAESDKYDFCLVDCPPAFNAASAAALMAADEAIIPIKLDAWSLRGMTNLLRQIANMREINPALRLAGLLPTMWYKSSNIAEAEQTLRDSGLPVFRPIRATDKVDDMTFAQEPLCVCSPRSAAGVDYRRFVQQYLEGGVSNG